MDQLLNKQLLVLLSFGLFSIIYNDNRSVLANGTKIDCFPIDGVTEDRCKSLGCIWSPVREKKVDHYQDIGPVANPFDLDVTKQSKTRVDEPWCYFPPNYIGYTVTEDQESETSNIRLKLKRVRPSALTNDINELTLDLTPNSEGNMIRVKIFDLNNRRFEPELPKLNFEGNHGLVGDSFKVELVEGENSNDRTVLVIKRKSTDAILFSTDLSKLIYTDRFIQLTSELDSPFVYGLGEHLDTFLKWVSKDQFKVYSMYNTDQRTVFDGQRSYGGFPFYINLDSFNQSQAHGVYLRNSNGMDIILHQAKSITFRPIGGLLDFFIFLGPTPNDVVSQYQHLVGKPDLPPLWSLGFHLCRYDYGSLEKTRLVWKRTREAGIPFDVQWNDIDYMERYNDFTYDHKNFSGLPEFVNELHQAGMHYVILFDPGVSQEENYEPYRLGVEMDIFIKNATNQILVGKVWNSSGRTVFPDFSNPKSHEYWSKLFKDFHKELPFDGAWIDMNDISNFVDGSLDGCPMTNEPIESPPYKPGGYELQHHSLCLSSRHFGGLEYDLHNLYSQYEAIATKKAIELVRPGKRPLIISRSTSPGQGTYGGHWSGDVESTWDYLRWSIPSLLEHSIYGFSLMGTDICGFIGDTTVDLCARWSTLGAFYTFSRNHNDDVSIDQDPVALGQVVVDANKNAQTKRYSLLPYLYSLMHKASKFAQLAVRSVPLEFHAKDPESLKVEQQFLWGQALMISPVVDPDTYEKSTYLPPGRWYETDILPDSEDHPKVPKLIDAPGGPKSWYKTKDISLANLPLFYRGGHIMPTYPKVKETIAKTIQQPIGLEIALCHMGRAEGELYHDDGETLDPNNYQLFHMKVKNSKLQVFTDSIGSEQVLFDLVKVYGIGVKVSKVEILSPKEASSELNFNQHDHMLVFNLNAIKAVRGEPIVVRWQ